MEATKLDVGIIGFGGYIPKYRIKIDDIAAAFNQDPSTIINGLFIEEKTVPAKDEDTITITIEAAKNALERAQINKDNIGAIYIGSESHPYAVKPSSTVVSQALGLTNNLTTADTQFACKAGTASIQIIAAMVKSGMIKYGMAIGADTS
ncbi:hydroxymethylglutaryl-CoA synthase, partial [Candidatus Woesearchaeota archaeon]|nr:hydroxymethylglutaryl-CoA synthase [Candidatus Woesearchaeota archaeon]